MSWKWIVIVGVVFFFVLRWLRAQNRIPAAQARQLVGDGALLVDVRSPAEFGSGHLAGARNIPVNQLAARAGELGDKSAPIILYCASGMRSGSAVGILKGAGFTAVHNLGPMSAYGS